MEKEMKRYVSYNFIYNVLSNCFIYFIFTSYDYYYIYYYI